MAQITFTDKENFKLEPTIPTNKKVRAEDLNEIKTVVNQNESLGLQTVASDATMTGDGTLGDPLSVVPVDVPSLQQVTDVGNQTSNFISPSSIVLPMQSPDPSYQPGRFFFDGKDFRLYDNISGTSISIGKEQVADVHNATGVTVSNFQVLRFAGTVAGVPSIALGLADTVAHAEGLAIATHDIVDGAVGKATFFGLVGGDTSAWAVDAALFLSSTVPGQLTDVEQPILAFIGRVLVSDAVNGVILIAPRGITNITAIGQVGYLTSASQAISSTPTKLQVFNNSLFEKNVNIVQAGGAPEWTAEMSPGSIGASGFYKMDFNISISSTANDIHIFEVYINDTPSNILGIIDLNNNNIDAGSTAFSVISPTIITSADKIEMWVYTDSGAASISVASCVFSITRIGNV